MAPREHFVEMLNRNLNLQRFRVFFVTGNHSGILSRLHRRFTELEIRRGFTTSQLMTILEDYSLIIVEHDPLLYEKSTEMVEYVQQALKQAAHEATALLYSPRIDPFLEDLTKGADRIFCFERGQRLRFLGRQASGRHEHSFYQTKTPISLAKVSVISLVN
jgi:hypothetical protein